MKLITHNDQYINVNGTHLQGYIDISYDELLEMFGEQTTGDGYKVDAEWMLSIDDVVITIYNWKDGKNYCGSQGKQVQNIRDWHIGGFSKEAEHKLKEYVQQYKEAPAR
jgi:hypothetical protein